MNKIKREPIIRKLQKNDLIIEFPKLEITFEKVKYEFNDLYTLENIHEIVISLKLYVNGQKSSRAVFLELINFLREILKISGKIDENSIIKYKKLLDANSVISLSTKQQKFSRASLFVRRLMRENILDDFPIPANFSNVKKEQKKSFGEIARRYIENDGNFDIIDIEDVMNQFSLDYSQAKILSYSLASIDIIHKKALFDISEWEKDWNLLDNVIKKLSENEIKQLRLISNFSKAFPIRERTLEEAFQILYSKFGNNIPAVKYWPRGMEEFFRSKSWKVSRVKNLLNGISHDLNDKNILNRAISNLSLEKKNKYKIIEDYYFNSDGRDPRSVELALSILYAVCGRLLPDSTKWPDGITDYLKYRGWKPNRVRGAFFPTPEVITPFIVGLLSHSDIAPNVDSVAFYTYITSFKPSSNQGKINVFMDKFRSKRPIEKDINSTDPMMLFCIRHSERMLYILKGMETEEVKYLISQDKIPLFLQYTAFGGKVRTLDKSSVSHIVKYFLEELAKENASILPLVRGGCTGHNFRPTIVSIKKISGESIINIQKLLNHTHSSVTKAYTERSMTQSMIFSKSKEFQQFLISKAIDEGSLKKIHKLNSGIEEVADGWINCEARRIWFKDNEVIAEWIALEQALRESEMDLKFENPERWEQVWLPKLIKFQSLLANVLEVDKRAASKLAEKIKLPPLS